MSLLIPNTRPVDSDLCSCPVELELSVIMVDNGGDCFWFHGPMDRPSAKRMAFAIMNGMVAEAYRVDIKLILPAACDVRAVTAKLDCLQSDPVRIILRVD